MTLLAVGARTHTGPARERAGKGGELGIAEQQGYLSERQLPLVDLLPQMRSARQNVFEPNAAVLSEEGSRVAAGAIGGWLESRYGGALSLAAQLSIAP